MTCPFCLKELACFNATNTDSIISHLKTKTCNKIHLAIIETKLLDVASYLNKNVMSIVSSYVFPMDRDDIFKYLLEFDYQRKMVKINDKEREDKEKLFLELKEDLEEYGCRNIGYHCRYCKGDDIYDRIESLSKLKQHLRTKNHKDRKRYFLGVGIKVKKYWQ